MFVVFCNLDIILFWVFKWVYKIVEFKIYFGFFIKKFFLIFFDCEVLLSRSGKLDRKLGFIYYKCDI